MPLPPKDLIDAINESSEVFFSAFDPCSDPIHLHEAITAFTNLVGLSIEATYGSVGTVATQLRQAVHIDFVGLGALVQRFQRDAFGVHRFSSILEAWCGEARISPEMRDEIKGEIRKLSIRINSDQPRKTRIAAAFSLWMCVFRPVSLDPDRLSVPFKQADLERFPARLNHWIAVVYLSRYGRVSLGDSVGAPTRLERIHHDFTYRKVCLSTLEALYAAMFRTTESEMPA